MADGGFYSAFKALINDICSSASCHKLFMIMSRIALFFRFELPHHRSSLLTATANVLDIAALFNRTMQQILIFLI